MQSVATLNLLPRKCFEITLTDGSIIKGKFGTWALKRFCDKKSLTLEEAGEKLRDLTGFTDYLLYAVEGVMRQSGEACPYTDVQCCDWIDQLGGLSSAVFLQLIAHTTEEAEEEKKTEPQA